MRLWGKKVVKMSEFLDLIFSASNHLKRKSKTSKWPWNNSTSFGKVSWLFGTIFEKSFITVDGTQGVSFFLINVDGTPGVKLM